MAPEKPVATYKIFKQEEHEITSHLHHNGAYYLIISPPPPKPSIVERQAKSAKICIQQDLLDPFGSSNKNTPRWGKKALIQPRQKKDNPSCKSTAPIHPLLAPYGDRRNLEASAWGKKNLYRKNLVCPAFILPIPKSPTHCDTMARSAGPPEF